MPPQKGLANQHRHLRRPALKLVQTGGKEALVPVARNAQPKGAEAGHEVPLAIAVAIAGRLPRAAFLRLVAHVQIAHPFRLRLQKMLPGQPCRGFQVGPEALLQIHQKVLEMFINGDNLRQGV